jgi:hypothetical protein
MPHSSLHSASGFHSITSQIVYILRCSFFHFRPSATFHSSISINLGTLSKRFASIAFHLNPCFKIGIASFSPATCLPQISDKSPPPYSGAGHNIFYWPLLAAHVPFSVPLRFRASFRSFLPALRPLHSISLQKRHKPQQPTQA